MLHALSPSSLDLRAQVHRPLLLEHLVKAVSPDASLSESLFQSPFRSLLDNPRKMPEEALKVSASQSPRQCFQPQRL
jgi:hypothetical protein